MMSKILCDKCGKDIKYKKNLVVVTYFIPFILKKYHNICYAKQEKTLKGIAFLGPKPVNSAGYKFIAIFYISVVLMFVVFLIAIPDSFQQIIQIYGIDFLTFLLIAILFSMLMISYPLMISRKYEKILE